MKLVSWNVNGLRAAERNGFGRWLSRTDADVVLLQEVRANPHQLSPAMQEPRGWRAHFAPAERPGYSGVALLARDEPDEVRVGLGVPRFDREGRVIMARFGRTCVFSTYFPNSGRTLERLPFKRAFYKAMLDHLEGLRAQGLSCVVGGDFNTAHREIDIARPKENVKNSGFTPVERKWLDGYVKRGWVDSWRALNPERAGVYTWWLQHFDARKRNVGWRIDYLFVDEGLMPRVRGAGVHGEVVGSDHCPVSLEVGA